MKTRVAILTALGLLVMSVSLVLAAQTDFSGTWVLDKSKSETPQLGQGRLGRAGQGAGQNRKAAAVSPRLVVTQTPDELTVERGFPASGDQGAGQRQTFRLDGAETTNQAVGGRTELKTKASWKGDTLQIRGTEKMSSQRGEISLNFNEVWSLSADGKVLTIKTTRTTARDVDITIKQVYNKQ
jgi:hypothetical protein